MRRSAMNRVVAVCVIGLAGLAGCSSQDEASEKRPSRVSNVAPAAPAAPAPDLSAMIAQMKREYAPPSHDVAPVSPSYDAPVVPYRNPMDGVRESMAAQRQREQMAQMQRDIDYQERQLRELERQQARAESNATMCSSFNVCYDWAR